MAGTENSLGQHIDKVAYGAAGVVGLLILALPFVLGGQVKDGEAAEEIRTLKERTAEKPPPKDTEELSDLSETLAKQWLAGEAASHDPPWVTERAPVLIRKIPQPPQEIPVHVAAKVMEISCARDPEKKVPYLVVKGSLGEGSHNIVMKKVTLLRKEEGGELLPVPGFRMAGPEGGFEHRDFAVVPGKTYSYQVRTTAAADPKAKEMKPLPPGEAEKTSDTLGPTPPVPHDFHVYISNFEPLKEGKPPRFFGHVSFWDWKSGKVVEVDGGVTRYFEEKEKFAGGRYELFQVLEDADKVTVKDTEMEEKHEIKSAESKLPRPIECFPAVTPAPPAPAEGEGEAALDDPGVKKAVSKGKGAPKAAAGKTEKGAATSKKDKAKDKTKDKGKTKAKDKGKEKDTGKKKEKEETKKKKKKFE